MHSASSWIGRLRGSESSSSRPASTSWRVSTSITRPFSQWASVTMPSSAASCITAKATSSSAMMPSSM